MERQRNNQTVNRDQYLKGNAAAQSAIVMQLMPKQSDKRAELLNKLRTQHRLKHLKSTTIEEIMQAQAEQDTTLDFSKKKPKKEQEEQEDEEDEEFNPAVPLNNLWDDEENCLGDKPPAEEESQDEDKDEEEGEEEY